LLHIDNKIYIYVGRANRIKFDKKKDFIGKSALHQQNETGLFRRLIHFTMDDDHDPENDVWMWGGEPIFRNGVYVGATTSGGYILIKKT
jgi:pyruvate dehydrogenase phosphatase regulatory subunit